MLSIAKKNISDSSYSRKISILQMSVIEMDTKLNSNEFDRVVAILSFSEMYHKEMIFCLKEVYRVLKDGGEFILVDEFKPKSFIKRLLYYCIRIPLLFITFIFTSKTTRSINKVLKHIEENQLKVIDQQSFLLDSLILLRIIKKDLDID
jgi:cyclopropane fatty-acyl-phospholipid synthase-like methyltransferase